MTPAEPVTVILSEWAGYAVQKVMTLIRQD